MASSSPILLVAINARYSHSALGARCLLANMGELHSATTLLEFDLHTPPENILRRIVEWKPAIVGLGAYIWNAGQIASLLTALRSTLPSTILILGGPEISYETASFPGVACVDYIIAGEAEVAFADLCRKILNEPPPSPDRTTDAPAGGGAAPLPSHTLHSVRRRIIAAGPVDPASCALPYDEYTDQDLAHRTIYVEASRGCPFHCAYCLSSLDASVRRVPIAKLWPALDRLFERGARSLRFVDRTFNLHAPWCIDLLERLRSRWKPGMQFHFELVPTRLPPALKRALQQFPPGALHLEVGIQTLNEETARRVRLPEPRSVIPDHLRFLIHEAGARVHLDLIAGLPGDSLDDIASSFDQLHALAPQEIQLGILKRLKGTAIMQHAQSWAMRFNPEPPYELIQHRLLPRGDMDRIKRFARYWEIMGNRGNFPRSLELLAQKQPSFFAAFMDWSDWLHAQTGRSHALPLLTLVRLFQDYLRNARQLPAALINQALRADYARNGRRHDVPAFLGK